MDAMADFTLRRLRIFCVNCVSCVRWLFGPMQISECLDVCALPSRRRRTACQRLHDGAQRVDGALVVHVIGGADVAAELDAKRAIDQGTRLAATL